jgi:hypothetical protein
MNCYKCKQTIPAARVNIGYKTCVSCSEIEQYGFVNIINHKTGNTIQPMPKAQAEAINKIGDRKRFGTVLKGGSKSTSYNPKNTKHKVSTAVVGSEALFEKVGREAMTILEFDGYDKALIYLQKELRERAISESQAFKIRSVLAAFSSQEKQLT